jgi:hypothetical protein
VCGSPNHWAKKCPNHKGRKPQPEQKTVNMAVSRSRCGTSRYSNSGANVHVCSVALLFSSYQVTQDSSVMMGNR